MSHTEKEAEKLVDYINDLNKKKSMIHELQTELAEEADDHAKSEHALQQLEEKFENLQLELEKR